MDVLCGVSSVLVFANTSCLTNAKKGSSSMYAVAANVSVEMCLLHNHKT